MTRRVFTVTIDVEVWNPTTLWQQAFNKATDENCLPNDEAYATLGTKHKPDVGACLRWLADPGVSWDGTDINDSSAEELT